MKHKNIIKAIIFVPAVSILLGSGCKKEKEEYITAIPEKALVWSDEFNSTVLDNTKWNVYHEYRRKDPTGRDAWWDKDNVYVENGNLVVKTSQRTDGAYAGACIDSKGKFENTYGYYETRVKLQTQEGHWGAFWLFAQSVNSTTNGRDGKDGTEIDVFESPYVGLGQDRMESALHYDGYGADHKVANKSVTGMKMNDGNWHTFAVEWTPLWYRFYYDDVMVWETNFGGISRVPQYLMISDEVGVWGGILDIRKATLPDYMLVDYVRVYNRK